MGQYIKVVFLMLLICSRAMANEVAPQKSIWKIFQVDNEIDKRAVLITDDYEIWLLHGLQPNRLTWNEWVWREDVPQPDSSYFLDIKKWGEGKTVSIIYSTWYDSEWKNTYRNDDSLLQNCEYVIHNSVFHAFAKPLQLDEWELLYTQLHEEAEVLIDRAFYGRAANLLKATLLFTDFIKKISIEWENRVEGKPFDERYISFNEKYNLYQPEFDVITQEGINL